MLEQFSNSAVYFEIPVLEMNRAVQFYQGVFRCALETTTIDSNEMALFPPIGGGKGITGALAKGEVYKPTVDGVVIYFSTSSIDETLDLVRSFGGSILYPKTDNGIGFVAEFQDSEGNRIALFEKYPAMIG